MKIAVIGSREFDDYELMEKALDSFKNIELIVSGGAVGADTLAELYAKNNGIETLIHYADWQEHGKAAGPIRNTQIVNDADFILAFWDGKSTGTKDSINKAYKTNTPIMVVYFEVMKIPVIYKGEVVGVSKNGNTIKFDDTKLASKLKNKLENAEEFYISARATGKITSGGKVKRDKDVEWVIMDIKKKKKSE